MVSLRSTHLTAGYLTRLFAGLAFAYDPDKYWVEIVKRSPGHSLKLPKNLSQTMLRIKEPEKYGGRQVAE